MKYIFIDIDNTILSHNTYKITDKTIYAIQEARRKGHKLFLATGRSKDKKVKEDIISIGFDGFVLNGGNYVEIDDMILLSTYFSEPLKEKMMCFLIDNSIPFYIQGDLGLFTDSNIYNTLIEFYKEYILKSGIVSNAKHNIVGGFAKGIKVSDNLQNIDVRKFFFVTQDNNNTICHDFPECDFSPLYISGKYSLFTEVNLKDTNKINGINIVLDYYNVDLKDAVAIGDSYQDIEMIKKCGIGIAMGNSENEVKECADYVTTSCDDEGIYNAFKHLDII